jgi:hypothetical protein
MSRSAVAADNDTPPSSSDAEAWLEGLAGRDTASESSKDGSRLRDALKLSADEAANPQPPPWKDIVAAARGSVPAVVGAQRDAANEGRWKRVAAGGLFVAIAMLGVGLWTMTAQDVGVSNGMRGAPSSAGPIWRTENPVKAAKDLAARLEAAGAHVTLTPAGPGVTLAVQCQPGACAAVAEQLSPLDMAVDADGRLALKVLPLR